MLQTNHLWNHEGFLDVPFVASVRCCGTEFLPVNFFLKFEEPHNTTVLGGAWDGQRTLNSCDASLWIQGSSYAFGLSSVLLLYIYVLFHLDYGFRDYDYYHCGHVYRGPLHCELNCTLMMVAKYFCKMLRNWSFFFALPLDIHLLSGSDSYSACF